MTMTGKRVLVTGATAGIGLETARQLVALGASVSIVGRNEEKTKAVCQALGHGVDYFLADLSSLKAVAALADEVRARYPKLDVLLNNAGGINLSRELTVDGYERTFAANHLQYMLLTQRLLPALQHGGEARVVVVASNAHRAGRLDFDDLMSERSYSSFPVYGTSKLANILFAREQARRLQGTKVTCNSLHPGFVASDFLNKGGVWKFLWPAGKVFGLSVEEGAKTSVYLASAPEVAGVSGQYFYKCKPIKPKALGRDEALARRLWDVSQALIDKALAA